MEEIDSGSGSSEVVDGDLVKGGVLSRVSGFERHGEVECSRHETSAPLGAVNCLKLSAGHLIGGNGNSLGDGRVLIINCGIGPGNISRASGCVGIILPSATVVPGNWSPAGIATG